MESDSEVEEEPRGDSFSVWAARISGLLLALVFLVFGVYLFESGGLDTLLPSWGWLPDGMLGGAFMGAGAGLGVTSITGENRWLSKLRARQESKGSLSQRGAPQALERGKPPGDRETNSESRAGVNKPPSTLEGGVDS